MRWSCSVVGKLLGCVTGVDVKIAFVSSNPEGCIFFSFNGYVVFAEVLIKIVHFYIIQLYVSKSVWNSYQEQFEMDTEICRTLYSKENIELFLCVKHTQSVTFCKRSTGNSQYYYSHYYFYACRIGEARSAREAGISFIFPWCVVHWHSDFKFPCSNLTVVKQFYFRKNALEVFLFVKCASCTKYDLVC
jgi:hypothetical protein